MRISTSHLAVDPGAGFGQFRDDRYRTVFPICNAGAVRFEPSRLTATTASFESTSFTPPSVRAVVGAGPIIDP
jgi:hypothetical protein